MSDEIRIADEIKRGAVKIDNILNAISDQADIFNVTIEKATNYTCSFYSKFSDINVNKILGNDFSVGLQKTYKLSANFDFSLITSETLSDTKRIADGLSSFESGIKDVTNAKKNDTEATKENSKAESEAGNIVYSLADAFVKVGTELGGNTAKLALFTNAINQFIKSSMESTSVSSFVSSGINFVVSLITTGISMIKESEEQRQEAFRNGVENLKKYTEELNVFNNSIKILNDAYSETEKTVSARNNLIATFDNMTLGYTEEGTAILSTNGTL